MSRALSVGWAVLMKRTWGFVFGREVAVSAALGVRRQTQATVAPRSRANAAVMMPGTIDENPKQTKRGRAHA
jgi:hypothetical protein